MSNDRSNNKPNDRPDDRLHERLQDTEQERTGSQQDITLHNIDSQGGMLQEATFENSQSKNISKQPSSQPSSSLKTDSMTEPSNAGDAGTPYTLLAVLLTLYFAQGMPSGFITQALPAILREYNVSLEMIGLSGLLLIPWAFKFLWAPVVDKYFHPKWGRSRSWIIPLQLISAVIMLVIGLFDPDQLSSPMVLWLVYGLLFLLGLTGATHDVAADGLATRSLSSFPLTTTANHSTQINSQQKSTLEANSLAVPYSAASDNINIPTSKTRSDNRANSNVEAQDSHVNNAATFHRQSMGENDDFVEVSQSIGLEKLEKDGLMAQQAILIHPYRGMGNAVQVIGYRLGLIVGGGVFLMVLGSWSWRYSFFGLAGLIILNTLPIWRYAEAKHHPGVSDPDNSKYDMSISDRSKSGIHKGDIHKGDIYKDGIYKSDVRKKDNKGNVKKGNVLKNKLAIARRVNQDRVSHADSVRLNKPDDHRWVLINNYLQDQYGYFWHNSEMRAWLMVLLSFKVVDGISSGMVKPMMVDMGIPTASIGLWASVLGSVAALLGAAIAAWLLKRMLHHTALLAFYGFQVVTTALYVIVAAGYEYPNWFGSVLAGHGVPFWWAYAANGIEHFSAALALVAMLTMVMHYARHQKAGSDFTTQVCLLTIFSGGSHLLSGFIAGQLGYTAHFTLSVVLGLICMVPLVYWRKQFISTI